MHNQALENLFAFGGFMVLTAIGSFILWLIVLIDVIISDFKNPNNKTIWIILLIFLAPAGALLYVLFGIQQKATTGKPVYNKNESINYRKQSTIDKNGGKWF